MVNYWKHQLVSDALLAAIVAGLFVFGPNHGLPVFFESQANDIVTAARMWVAPALTLLGMMSATTVFVFAVSDRPEYRFLKLFGADRQLWSAFGENIVWLGLSAIFAASLSFVMKDKIDDYVKFISGFFFAIVSICILKFCWMMFQIISVRIAQSKSEN